MGTALDNLFAALDKHRQERYGLLWDSVDWYGIAARELPEYQRQDIMRYIRNNVSSRIN